MIKTRKKLSISLTTNDEKLKFSISPIGTLSNLDKTKFLYEIDIDINTKNIIKINFIEKTLNDSYLKIEKIVLNDILLNYIDSFSSFKTNGKNKRTYGWMNEEGCYIIKLHANPVTQNLIAYLLSMKN